MAKLTSGSSKEKLPKKGKGSDNSKKEPEKSKKEINKEDYVGLLKKGESLRSDGIFMYRPLKKEYERVLHEKPKPIYASSLAELREKEDEFRYNIQHFRKGRDSKLSVAQAYDRWISLDRNTKENTLRNYINAFENNIRHTKIGRMHIADVRKSDIMSFYNGILDQGKMGVETLGTLQSVLSLVFSFAVDDRIIPGPSPCDGALDHLRKDSIIARGPKRGALTLNEQYTFLTFLDMEKGRRKWLRLFTVLLLTGMRIGELTGLQWSDVDLQKNVIHIRHNLVYFSHPLSVDPKTGNKSYFEMHELKTHASCRDIPIFPLVREMLLEEKRWQDETNAYSTYPVVGSNGRVYQDFCFFNRWKRPYEAGALTDKVLSRLIRDCNIAVSENKIKDGVVLPHFSCHVLRHTAATRLIELGISPSVVQSFLGHADVQTTMQVYVNVTESFKMRELGMETTKPVPNVFEEAVFGKNKVSVEKRGPDLNYIQKSVQTTSLQLLDAGVQNQGFSVQTISNEI